MCIRGRIGQRSQTCLGPGLMHPAHRAEAPFHAHRPGTFTLLRLVPRGLRGARGHTVNFGGYGAAGSMGHAEAVSVARRSPKEGPSQRSAARALIPLQPQVSLRHTAAGHSDRQPAVAGLVYVLPIAVVENVGAAVLAVAPFGG